MKKLINYCNHLLGKKIYFIFVIIAVMGLFFSLGINSTEALSCSYSPPRSPPLDRYGCLDSGACDTYGPGSGTACTGEWTNCTQYTNSVTGERWMSCSCSTSCQSTGRTISSSSCGSNNVCSYSYGNICNGGNVSGGNCIRVTPLDSNGNPVSGGPGNPPESVCNSEEFSFGPYGGTSFTTYVGDSTYLSFQYSTSAGARNISAAIVGCPAGATCTPSATTTEWVAPSDGNLVRGVTVTPTNTTPGTYNVSVKAYVAENPSCAKYANYTITVKPSRKMVCDGGWHDIPPNPIGIGISSGPLALWNNGSQSWDKYIKATYNGRYYTQVNQTTWSNANFSTRCNYTNGMADTCTWDLPVNMPNTGSNGYQAVPGWPMDTSGPYGSGTTVTDSNNRTIELKQNGNSFQYKCSTVQPPSNEAVCDGAWRYLPDRGATLYQPVGAYVGSGLDSQYKDSVAIATGGNGSPVGAYITSCKFNGTNTCRFESNWTSIGAVTSSPLNISLGWSLEVNLKTTWAGGEWVKNINRNSGWSGWANQGADNGMLWGQPYRFQDKLGRYWQLRNASGGVAYACGTNPVCVSLNFDSSRSSISKTNLNGNEAFTVKCDYGVRGIDAVGVTTGGGATCAFSSWDSGNNSRTTANFNCTAGTVGGTYSVACINTPNTSSNVCAQANTLGNITVSAQSATADINANPLTIPYNSASTISWTSSNASSCSVTPTGWIGTSGSQSSGNLTNTRTYTLDCVPSGPNSSDSVTVTVQPAANFTLNVIRSGQGTVTSAPSGINCGATCNASFVQNTSVTLTATPAQGRIFTGWGGACSGKGTCTVVMSSSRTVYANFAVDPNFKEF